MRTNSLFALFVFCAFPIAHSQDFLVSKRADSLYSLACSETNSNNALEYLTEAFTDSPALFGRIETDDHLKKARGDPRWPTVLSHAKLYFVSFSLQNTIFNISALAAQYTLRPKSMGGGEGSYVGFGFSWITIPLIDSTLANYSITVLSSDAIAITGKSKEINGSIELLLSGFGVKREETWTFLDNLRQVQDAIYVGEKKKSEHR